MAAPSLLSFGRAATRKALRLEAWALRGAAPPAALCTRPGGFGTPPDGNVVAPQGSTKLLATKATVEFPKMLSSNSLPVSANEGESISSTNLKEASKPADEDLRMLMSRKTMVAFPQRVIVSSLEEEKLTTAAAGGSVRKELAEEETLSSSSSDSDSSSDSEEENDDDDSEVAIKTRVEFPRRDSIFSENIAIKALRLPKDNLFQKSHKEYVAKKKPSKTETDESTIKQVTFSKTSVSRKTLKSKARDPNMKSAPKEADRQKLVLEPHLDENEDLTDTTLKSGDLEEKSIGTQVATTQLKAPSGIQEDKKPNLVSRGEEKRVKEAWESEAVEVTSPKLEEETSENAVLVMGTKEETMQEAGVQAGESSTVEETTAAAQPAPEEFDNSTYKNLQHHEYNMYTFVDSVVVLSKFRQPQPSSGRPSPRH